MFLLSRRVRFRYSLRKHLYCDARKVLSRPGSKERAELGAERVGRWWRAGQGAELSTVLVPKTRLRLAAPVSSRLKSTIIDYYETNNQTF